MTENEIFDQVYSLYSGDVDYWATDSDEYALLRQYSRAGIDRWRYYERTDWKELFTSLADASTGRKVVSGFTASCPDDFVRNTGFVFIGSKKFTPVSPAKASTLIGATSTWEFCWFTGSAKTGFTLHINPSAQISNGDTIEYPYYRKPTYFSTTTDVTEMSDPFFLVYFILSRLYKNDGEGFADEFNKAEAILEQMRTTNMSGVEEVADDVEWVSDEQDGFGY